MSKLELPAGQDNVIVRNQEVYGYLPKDVIDRMGDTSTQLATENQTVLGAINELKSNLINYITGTLIDNIITGYGQSYTPDKNGWVYLSAKGTGSGGASTYSIDGIQVMSVNATDTQGQVLMLPIASGQTLTSRDRSDSGTYYAYFIG